MKTATELGISAEQKQALIAVRDKLRSGAYRHAPSTGGEHIVGECFNMGTYALYRETDCGSCGCIAGWVAHDLKIKHASAFATKGKMKALCYPSINGRENFWDDITPELAAKAIDNTLRLGRPMWARVIKDA